MSEVKHIVPFEDKKESEVNSTGMFMFFSYGEDEKITGLVINEDGIKVRIN